MGAQTVHESDVLVVGGGIAGAFAAIRATELGAKVLLVDKSFFGRSGTSSLASGVFACYMPGDDMDEWLNPALHGPLVNRGALARARRLTYDLLLNMDRWGVKWIKEGDRIVRVRGAAGPQTFATNAMLAEGGPQMMIALRNETLRRGVQVVNRIMVTDLLTSDGRHPTGGRVIGAVGMGTITGELHLFKAKAIILCTGPIKFPYPPAGSGFQGMPLTCSGDGVAAAFRAGAYLRKMELAGTALTSAEFYCAPALEMGTEVGMRFVNAQGEEILPPQQDGLRRHLLGRAALRTYHEGRGPVFVDLTHLTPDRLRLFKQVVPIVLTTFERAGYDLTKDKVPYIESYRLQSGIAGCGIKIDEQGATSLPGLYAAGNSSDGAYIGAVQPLDLCAAVGWYAGESAAKGAVEAPEPEEGQIRQLVQWALAPLGVEAGVTFDRVRQELEPLYGREITHVLEGERLEQALAKLRGVKQELMPRLSATEPRGLVKANGMRNFLECLEISMQVLLHRQESRGSVLRADYPYTDNEKWLSYTMARREAGGETVLWDEPVPDTPDYAPPRERRQFLHPFFKA